MACGARWGLKQIRFIGQNQSSPFHQKPSSGASPDEPVFLAYKRVLLNRYSLPQIINWLKSLGKVERGGGAHLFRKTFAMVYVDNEGDIYDLKTLRGHEHLITTEGYAKSTNRRKV
jgi:site-specific recombinase XerD